MNCRSRLGAAVFALALVALASPVGAQVVRAPEVVDAYQRGLALMTEAEAEEENTELRNRKYAEAVSAFNEAIRLDGSYPDPYIAKGDALQALGDYQSAGTSYARATEVAPDSAAAYLGRGECFMNMSPPDYNLALNDFRTALELDRGNAKALADMGHVLILTGQDPTSALRYLDDALSLRTAEGALILKPKDGARAYRDRGMAYAQLREFDKSIADLEEAVKVDPDDYENFSSLATIYLFQDKFKEAAEALTQAIAAYKPTKSGEPKTFVTGYLLRADARLRLGDAATDPAERTAAYEGVIADANAVLTEYDDENPQGGRALFRRGRAERMLERYGVAVDTFTEAITSAAVQPDIEYLAEAYLYRGISFYYMGVMDLARGDFEQASATGNGFQDPRVFLWLGYTYHKEGDYRRAIDAYSEAIAKAPGFALAHVNKGRAYMDLEEYNRAIESFNNAIRAEPNVGEHYYNVGFAYLQLEEFDTAKEMFGLALLKPNPQPKMYRGMAAALRGLGRNELAAEYDQRAAGG